MKTVSCIIPTRNRCDMVKEAVASAMNQEGFVCGGVDPAPKHGRLEIVVVDDGSADDTVRHIGRFFPEVKLVSAGGLGPGAARNAGVGEASGEILMFLDSDDLWSPEHVRFLMEAIDHGSEAAGGITRTIDLLGGDDFFVPSGFRESDEIALDNLARWCFLVPSAFAVTRRAFVEAGGFPRVDFGEDWLFFLQVAARSPIRLVHRVVTVRRLHKGSLCRVLCDPRHICDLLDRVREMIDRCGGHGLTASLKIDRMKDIVRKEGDRWKSVQDWFSAMNEHGLISNRA